MLKVSLYALGISCIVAGLLSSEIGDERIYATLNTGEIDLPQLRRAFLRVKKTESVNVCGEAALGYVCVESANVEMSGSSVLFLNRENHSYIMTAEHVCAQSEQSDMDIFLNNEQEKSVMLQILGMTRIVSITRNVSYNLMNVYGRTAENVQIVGVNQIDDLCILRSDRVEGIVPVTLSARSPGLGDEVWNIAAPYGIFDFNMVPMLRGVWCGRNPAGGTFICDLPASPGSSGSPVFNENGHLVSIIHSTHVQFHAASFGANIHQIRQLISDSIQ